MRQGRLPDIIARCLTACFPSNTPTPSAAGLLELLDGPHQRLNGTLQIFRVHLVRFVARKVDADQHDIASIAEAVGSIASDVGSNRNLPNSQLRIGASYIKVMAGISPFATCDARQGSDVRFKAGKDRRQAAAVE